MAGCYVDDCDGCMCPSGHPPCGHCTDHRLALKAKVAREALIAATENDPSPEVAHYGQWVANHASNVTLAKLGRMLK